MSRVAVTGASGGLGRFCVEALLDAGWDVVAIDRVRGHESRAHYVDIDVTDFGQTLEALSGVDGLYDGVDAIVHLAAIPAPGITTSSRTFQNNIVATHNVFLAAKVLGIDRVVFASSETVLGLPFTTPPLGIPVTEEFAPRPESTYGMVKVLEETMATIFCQWNPALTMTALRLSNVINPDWYPEFPSYDADPQLRRWNLWGYVDARDAASAVVLALGRSDRGFDVFIVAASDTVMSRPNSELIAAEFSETPVAEGLGDHDTLLSIDKARRVLNYRPQYSWRDLESEATDTEKEGSE
ncbi:nucleoside-diphosphate-sugar epimerase [Mycetocola sp. CAN_C7]|uniref:NAD-dependent epimerase/dehydratase family protein n=1 Tax=Mycetocola sp. CAN_C7 TaxID=2787724 RepID=UPI0018CA8D5D